MLNGKKICFLGAGSIAEAMIAGITQQGIVLPEQIFVMNRSNKDRIKQLVDKYGIQSPENKFKTIASADILILAVKPKDVWDAIDEISSYSHSDQLIITVLAGVSTNSITEAIDHHGPIIRAMPNTSSMIGLSATAISKGKHAKKIHLEIAEFILSAIGSVTIIKEDLMDAVTGLSGSGPAYLYYLVEAMESAAVDMGMEHSTARELIIQTVIGAGNMLKETREEPSILRERVTSPGGSTMAGLEVMNQYQVKTAMEEAIKKATLRSKELGKSIINVHQ